MNDESARFLDYTEKYTDTGRVSFVVPALLPKSLIVNDLRAHVRRLQRDLGYDVGEAVGAQLWLQNVFTPGAAQAYEAVGRAGDPTQAYCDLLEVRWLLSEEAGRDVGDETALEALGRRAVPKESAADIAFVDVATRELPVIPPLIGQEDAV